jgi:hypothetical protein
MSTVVNELPTISCHTDILSAKSLPINSIITNEDNHCIDQLTDRFKPSNWVHGNGRSLFQFRNKYFYGTFFRL